MMNATVSNEELVRQAFDAFFDNAKLKGITFTDDQKELLGALEDAAVEGATDSYSTEIDLAFENGYEEGFSAGYDQCIYDYDVEV